MPKLDMMETRATSANHTDAATALEDLTDISLFIDTSRIKPHIVIIAEIEKKRQLFILVSELF